MPEKTSVKRRSYLKKSAATIAVAGGILGTSQSAAADTRTATISGYGDYVISVSDSGGTIFKGSVSGGSDEVEFDEYITSANLDGDLEVEVENVESVANVGDHVEVSGSNISYAFGMTDDNISMESDCESTEGTNSTGSAYGKLEWSDTDTFEVQGTIEYLKSYNSGGVLFDHS